MAKNVVHIFGGAGSGTSTLGRYISSVNGWFFMDTDDYYWEDSAVPYTVKREIPDRVRLMTEDIVKHDNIVISGALSGWETCSYRISPSLSASRPTPRSGSIDSGKGNGTISAAE